MAFVNDPHVSEPDGIWTIGLSSGASVAVDNSTTLPTVVLTLTLTGSGSDLITFTTPQAQTAQSIAPNSGSFTDAAGNVYAIDANGNALENGSLIDGGSNTGAMAIANGIVYGQDATTKSWYTWNQSTWTQSAAPQAVVSTVSPSGSITAGSGSFTDAAGNVYAIDANGNALENGSLIDGGSNTGAMAIANGVVYGQDATTKSWYTWNQTTWTQSAAPPIDSSSGAFAANVQLNIVNDTGHTIDGFAVDLGSLSPTFSNIDPKSFGGEIGFFTADDAFSTINGSPSQIAVLNALTPGATATGNFTVSQPNTNNFSLSVIPNIPTFGAGSNASVSVPSGDGSWTIIPSADSTIAITDPPAVGLTPSAKIVIDLTKIGTDTISFIAPPTPGEVDSIGFTAGVEVDVVNNTGQNLSNLLLSVANSDPALPRNLVPPTVHYGIALQANDPNYAFFANLDPTSFGGKVSLFDPTGKATNNTTGAAASQIVISSLAAGGTSSGSFVLHNTELTDHNNSFAMTLTS